MQYTNKMGLDAALCRAIAHDPYTKEGDFSGSELPTPPQIRTLKLRYDGLITVDVSDLIYPLLGNNTHYILQRMGIKNGLQEESFKWEVLDYIVSGRPDFYDEFHCLWDYKVTSRYVLISGVKWEWEAQTNIYAWLLQKYNFTVKDIKINCIFRDWSKIQAMKIPDYPKNQVVVFPVTLWYFHDTYEYIVERIELHKLAESLPDSKLPECTPEERWEKPTVYAVKKKGQKKAVRLLKSEKEAGEYIDTKHLDLSKHFIEMRKGESMRCEYYCDVSQFCHQYNTKIKEN